jgi:hypothetical protein
MPVHDEAPYLAEALDSLFVQTYEDFEVICIDDGSTDGTASLLEAYQRRDSRLVVCHQPSSGIVHALNRGCCLARGRYIARMDGDDVALPDRLERQVAFLDQHPEVAVLGGAAILVSADGTPFSTASCPSHDSEIKAVLARSNPFTHATVTMRTAALDAVGFYRAAAIHAEDYDLWLRMAERFQLAGLAQPVLCYRVHQGQATSRQLREQALASLAVRIAAASRRAQGHDPLADGAARGEDARAVLDTLGVDEQTITSELLDTYIAHAYTLARSGARATARAVWMEAAGAARRSAGRGRLQAKVLLARARLHREQGHPVRAVGTAARACVANPALAGELLGSSSRRSTAYCTEPFREPSAFQRPWSGSR